MVKIGRPAGLLPQDDESEMWSHYPDIYYCDFMTSVLLIRQYLPWFGLFSRIAIPRTINEVLGKGSLFGAKTLPKSDCGYIKSCRHALQWFYNSNACAISCHAMGVYPVDNILKLLKVFSPLWCRKSGSFLTPSECIHDHCPRDSVKPSMPDCPYRPTHEMMRWMTVSSRTLWTRHLPEALCNRPESLIETDIIIERFD